MNEDAGVAREKEQHKTQTVLTSRSLEFTRERRIDKVTEIHE